MMSNDEDEQEDLEQFLKGDDFLTEEERQEKSAQERRLARKRRLQQALVSEEEVAPPPHQEVERNDNPPIFKEALHQEIFPEESQEGTEEENTDMFDIFSNSVSPANNNAQGFKVIGGREQGSVDRQQDWDDTEGYYKATIVEVMHLDLPNAPGSDIQFKIAGVIGNCDRGQCSTAFRLCANGLFVPLAFDATGLSDQAGGSDGYPSSCA